MLWTRIFAVSAMLVLSSVAGLAGAQVMDKKVLSLDGAKKIAAAAEVEAMKNNWIVVIAVVDDGGHLIYLQRLDGTQTGSVAVAIGKAQTSAGFKRPTKALEDAIAGGRNAILALHAATPLEGGLPVIINGQVVGAVGVSGVKSVEDAQIAKAGIDALGN